MTPWPARSAGAALCVAFLASAACGDSQLPPGLGPGQSPTNDASASSAAVEGTLSTRNSIGRSGTFFLPAGYAGTPKPLMLAYHGTGGSGADMVAALRDAAAAASFIIVAPDSRKSPSGEYTWEVGNNPGEKTEDYTHALACIAEVRGYAGVQIDPARIVALGFSGGASSAPYIATNETMFSGYAVMHGGVVQGGIGTNVIRGWFSTGDADTLRPASLVQQSVDYMKSIGFGDVVFNVYAGGHQFDSGEVAGVVGWWL